MAVTSISSPDAFVTVPGDRHSEVARTLDRRILALTIAALTTAGALFLTIADYENFLILLGSVFVPMSAVLIVDFFVLARGRWDLSGRARTRWLMLLPWAAGFVTCQFINPGYVSWWVSAWTALARRRDGAARTGEQPAGADIGPSSDVSA